MNSVIRPIALLKQRDIDVSLEQTIDVVREWESAWLSRSKLEVDCRIATDLSFEQDGGVWRAYCHPLDTVIWIYCLDTFAKHIEMAIFELDENVPSMDRHRDSGLAKDIASKALDELILSVITKLFGTSATQIDSGVGPDKGLFKWYSGTAVLKLKVGDATLSMLIPVDRLASRWIAPATIRPQALTPLKAALTDIEMRVIAELGHVDMSLGSFTSLQVGDVINLSIGIDHPLTVFSENRSPVGAANLGQQGGHRALNMFKLPQK